MAASDFLDSYGPGSIVQEGEQQKKQRIASSVISQLGELEKAAQISVLRSVAAFYELEGELG